MISHDNSVIEKFKHLSINDAKFFESIDPNTAYVAGDSQWLGDNYDIWVPMVAANNIKLIVLNWEYSIIVRWGKEASKGPDDKNQKVMEMFETYKDRVHILSDCLLDRSRHDQRKLLAKLPIFDEDEYIAERSKVGHVGLEFKILSERVNNIFFVSSEKWTIEALKGIDRACFENGEMLLQAYEEWEAKQKFTAFTTKILNWPKDTFISWT